MQLHFVRRAALIAASAAFVASAVRPERSAIDVPIAPPELPAVPQTATAVRKLMEQSGSEDFRPDKAQHDQRKPGRPLKMVHATEATAVEEEEQKEPKPAAQAPAEMAADEMADKQRVAKAAAATAGAARRASEADAVDADADDDDAQEHAATDDSQAQLDSDASGASMQKKAQLDSGASGASMPKKGDDSDEDEGTPESASSGPEDEEAAPASPPSQAMPSDINGLWAYLQKHLCDSEATAIECHSCEGGTARTGHATMTALVACAEEYSQNYCGGVPADAPATGCPGATACKEQAGDSVQKMHTCLKAMDEFIPQCLCNIVNKPDAQAVEED